MPKGLGLNHYAKILKDLIGVEYHWDDELVLGSYNLRNKPKIEFRIQCFNIREINELLSCFKYLIKHENSEKNFLILRIIMDVFKKIPQTTYQKTRISVFILEQLEFSLVEALKYENKFGSIQESKFKIVLSFYNMVLSRATAALPSSVYVPILQNRMIAIVSMIQELVKLHVTRPGALYSGKPVIYCTAYKNHTFCKLFDAVMNKDPKIVIREKLYKHFHSGVLRYGCIYYIVYYFLQALKFLLKNIVGGDCLDIRKSLLAALIIYDDPELIRVYNEFNWSV